MKTYQQFFAELKRRNAFKVSAVYGAVAFGLIQVADPLADAMRLPDMFVPFVVALLVLGFPVALVLAWAFELNPSATVALANVHRDRWEWNRAEATYRRALQLDPDNVEAHQQYAEFLGYVGRLDEANEAAARALALDRSPIRLNVAGYLTMHDNRIGAAIQYLDEGIRADAAGKLAFLRGNRALAHMMTDEDPAGRTMLLDFVEANSPEIAERAARVWPPATGLPTPGAIEVIEELGGITSAQLWMLVDRPERAIEHIVTLKDRVSFGQTDHWWSPILDPLRDDPRFVVTQEAWGPAAYEVLRTGDTELGP